MFSRVFHSSALARTLRKSSGTRFERASRASHAKEGTRRTIFLVSKRKNDSRGPSGAPRETPWGSSGTLLAVNLALLSPSWGLFGGFLAALGRLGLALGDACCPKISKLRSLGPLLDDFRPLGAQFAVEKLRNRAESLRNHDENMPAALCLQRRTPTRVRRSREANSILI